MGDRNLLATKKYVADALFLSCNEINEHFKQSKSLLFISHLALHLMFKMSTFRHYTSFLLIAPLVTHSHRSTTTMLALSCPRFRPTQPRQEFLQSGAFPSFLLPARYFPKEDEYMTSVYHT